MPCLVYVYGLMTLVCLPGLVGLPCLGLCLRINDSGLFAWISLTALYRTMSTS